MVKRAKGFFDINAWQKADDLAVDVYESTKSFPRHQLYRLTNQMQRAAVSVAANIAEGSGRRTLTDDLRFLYIAKGSLTERQYIHLAKRRGFLSLTDYQRLSALQDETACLCYGRQARVLTGFIRFKEQEAESQGT